MLYILSPLVQYCIKNNLSWKYLEGTRTWCAPSKSALAIHLRHPWLQILDPPLYEVILIVKGQVNV